MARSGDVRHQSPESQSSDNARHQSPESQSSDDDSEESGSCGQSPVAAVAPLPVPGRRVAVSSPWTVEETARRVRALGADWADDRFVSLLRQHEVDGAALAELTKGDLRDDFGIKELGRVKRILREINTLCFEPGNQMDLTRGSVVTPEPGAFDMPISEEDLKGPRDGNVSGNVVRAPQPPPRPVGPGPTLPQERPAKVSPQRVDSASPDSDIGGEVGAGRPTSVGGEQEAEGDTPEASPQRPVTCPPNPAASAARAGETRQWEEVDEDDIDAIDLADLVPDRGRSIAGRSALPPRPVTAIGHRPMDDYDSDEEVDGDAPRREMLMLGEHRHVWEDDPAVEIRHPSDPERDLGARMTPPPGHLIGRAEEPPPRLAWAQAPRPAPIPRPPVEMGGAGSRLPNGKMVPEWVFRRHEQGKSTRATEAEGGSSTQKQLAIQNDPPRDPPQRDTPQRDLPPQICASPSPEPEAFACGILEQERRYAALHAVHADWLAAEPGGVRLADLRTALGAVLGWSEEEAIERTQGAVGRELDWHLFHKVCASSCRGASPQDFDMVIRQLRASVGAAASRIERGRRIARLEKLFRRWTKDRPALPRQEVSLVMDAAEAIERVRRQLPQEESIGFSLLVPESDNGWVNFPAFLEMLEPAVSAGCTPSDFDQAVYRVERVLADRARGAEVQRAAADGEVIECLAAHSAHTTPVILCGSADPSTALEMAAERRGVTLRHCLVSADKSARSALRVISRGGFNKGHWAYVVLGRGFDRGEDFMRELGVLMQGESAWSIHQNFRLWIYAPEASEATVPSVLLLRSVCTSLNRPADLALRQFQVRSQASSSRTGAGGWSAGF
eukprot:Hpha_TRINITY_DN443_c0_g1::TRINITY_DN443_c0_g1_i1::g.27650::m.27650